MAANSPGGSSADEGNIVLNAPLPNSKQLEDNVVLLPFNFVESAGARFFFHKNFPNLQLPCRQTLSVQGIDDVYDMVKNAVLKELKGIRVLCAMFDGWSDSHGYPYLGLRVGYITHRWDYRDGNSVMQDVAGTYSSES